MYKTAICLNMIVKNESHIIIRLLQSILPIIDTYIICDTGSTDNTPQLIIDFFDIHNIKGEIIYKSFINFGYNRTYALNYAKHKYQCLDMCHQQNHDRSTILPDIQQLSCNDHLISHSNQHQCIITYALLIDADMIVNINPAFNKQLLTDDVYLIIQKSDILSYYNTRLINLNINVKCVGPTHEYYDLPPGITAKKLDSIWILDIGDGGSKIDKYDRDIRLLKQGIVDEPDNSRYYFYLANSYFNAGRHNESIPYYIKRIELGGWIEELFYSHLNLGHAYKTINKDELAICTWLNGYNIHSTRSETIYQITKYYREKGQHKLAMVFCMLGKNITYPIHDILFIHNDVYNIGFDYELSIIGYYNNYPNLHKLICMLMNKLPIKYDNLLSNYKYCYPNLSSFLLFKRGDTEITDDIDICGTTYKMYGSNPSIFKIGNKYMLNIRFVNYKLLHNGTYQFAVNDDKIISVNKIYELNDNFDINKNINPIILLPSNNNNDLKYIGIEDLKPYYNADINTNNIIKVNKLAFIGTIQHPITHNLVMGYGELNISNIISDIHYSVVDTDLNKQCEKNWVFYGNYNIIYKWYPLTIGKISYRQNNLKVELCLQIIDTKIMPDYFKHVRGSTNGFEYDNDIWFICHIVDHDKPRIYYHLFAIFDKHTMELKKWSNLFKFDDAKIEFSLGLIVEKTRIIISYSKWDNYPTIGIYNKELLEKALF